MSKIVPTPKNNNPIIIDGQELPVDEYGRVHLNSLHKLSGAGGHKRPYEWLRLNATQQLLEEYSQNDDSRSGVSTQNGGSNSGTYANELLAVSYAGWISPAFQLKVNAVFLAVRNGELQPAIPQTRAEILRLALEVEEKNEQLTAENKKLEIEVQKNEGKAKFMDQFVNADGLYGIQNAGRALGCKPNLFSRWLKQDYLFYQGNALVPKAKFIQQGIFEVKSTIIDDKARPRAFVTPKGLEYLALRTPDNVRI